MNNDRLPSHAVPRWPWLAAGLALALGACSSTPPPREQLAASRAVVERATNGPAADAPLDLAAARDKLARANAAMDRKDYRLARQLAEEAEADAAYAEAQSRENRSDQSLGELRESIRRLRAQLDGAS